MVGGALLLLLSGCQPATPPVGATRTTPAPTARQTPSPLPPCSATAATGGAEVLKAGLPGPDDLAFDPDGRLLISDIHAGTVSRLNPDGSITVVARGLSAPEGMVIAPDGRLLIAEQGRNRVVAVDLATYAVSLWRTFPNRTGRDGIDGIGPRLPNGDIVVPDSPNGVVWRVSADGKSETRIGSGMARPVGAATDAQGHIFVADEGGPLWVLEPGQRRLTTLSTPDDVVVSAGGHLFVNTIGDGAIHELDSLGHTIEVMRNIRGPQGIALDGADNLYYTEFDAGRVDRVVRTFLLGTTKVSATGHGTDVICPNIRRAAGYADALVLTPDSKAAGAIVRVQQPGVDASGAIEVRPSAGTVTFSIGAGALTLSQTVALP